MKKYKTIYADPPWRFKNFSEKGEGRNAISHYDCLTLADLKKLNIQRYADKDCALFMWVTDPMLDQGIELMQDWGFKFKTVAFYWAKTNIKVDLKIAHFLVTSMSLSAVDAILEGVPVICHKENVASYVSSQDIKEIEDPFYPPETRLYYWLQQKSNHQFTLEEIENGFARDYLKGVKWNDIKL